MIALLCFFLTLFASPFKSKSLLAIARKQALAARRGKSHDRLASIFPDLRP
jgi:hypothetical protein